MSLEDDVVAYQQIVHQIGELEEQKKTLGQAILAQMNAKCMNFAHCTARRYNRLSIRIPLEQARTLNATAFVEQVDKEKIKKLYQNGTPLEGVKEISYLVVLKNQEGL